MTFGRLFQQVLHDFLHVIERWSGYMSRGHRSATFALLDYVPHIGKRLPVHIKNEVHTGTNEVINVKLGQFVQGHSIVVARVDFVRDVRSTFLGGGVDDNVT